MEYQQLANSVHGAGFRFFDRGAYNLNIVGVRTDEDAANTFNDWLYLAFRDESNTPHCLAFRCTTDPGVDYRVNPINPRGTGIIARGQHRGAYEIGEHKGLPALVQRSHMRVHRDNDGDAYLDRDDDAIEWCMGGFNIHRSKNGGESVLVGKWSAGCQVLANSYDMDIVLALAHRAAVRYGPRFTYTLLSERDVHGQKD